MRSFTVILALCASAALALPTGQANTDSTSGLTAVPKIGVPIDTAGSTSTANVHTPRFPPGFTSVDVREAAGLANAGIAAGDCSVKGVSCKAKAIKDDTAKAEFIKIGS